MQEYTKELVIEAIEGSIKKWEYILTEAKEDNGIDDCPLCQLFFGRADHSMFDTPCKGCPVEKKTGKGQCSYTPYKAWAFATSGLPRSIATAQFPEEAKQAAKEELIFLKELLKEYKGEL